MFKICLLSTNADFICENYVQQTEQFTRLALVFSAKSYKRFHTSIMLFIQHLVTKQLTWVKIVACSQKMDIRLYFLFLPLNQNNLQYHFVQIKIFSGSMGIVWEQYGNSMGMFDAFHSVVLLIQFHFQNLVLCKITNTEIAITGIN